MKSIFVLLLVLFSQLVNAYDVVEKEMSSGNTLTITEFEGDGETLLLWIPSERGYRGGSLPVTMDLAALGIDVRAIDIHASYMIQEGSRSFNDFDNADLMELIAVYKSEGFKEVYLMSAGRGSVVSLQLARDWQLKYPKQKFLKGFIFTHPHLIDGRPEIGSDATYVDIGKLSNLPVYMFQPEYSTKYARSIEIANVLKQGGSPVFIHTLKEAQGGFYMRDDKRVNPADLKIKAQFPSLIQNAIKIMRTLPHAEYAVSKLKVVEKKDNKVVTPAFRSAQLYPFTGDKTPPKTILKTFDGKNFDLASLKGEVVLVNFWATWCGPCIEEIPSLNRLLKRLENKPFRVVAVNIGEPKHIIEEFLKQLEKTGVSLDFPVLLDEKGNSVRDWKVYAYPSNYIINASGEIEYAYRGALKWDAPHVVEKIESMLE